MSGKKISMNASYTHHLHPISAWIGVLKEKHGEEHDEERLDAAGEKHAEAKPPVARR